MAEPPVTGKLELHWVRVVDDRGRTHMEGHWTAIGAAPATSPHATHAA